MGSTPFVRYGVVGAVLAAIALVALVVFTDISPYTTDEAPVRLPDDQAVQ